MDNYTSSKLFVLQDNISLYNRVKIFIWDLLNFNNNKTSSIRLDYRNYSTFYMSSIYFTDQEINYLLSFIDDTTHLTLKETLHHLITTKLNICTSHDIAPIIMSFFSIHKNFQKDLVFKKYLKQFEKNFSKSLPI